MKHYMDIENLREEVIELGGEITRDRNDYGFKKGDLITITEKIDGSNTSITYDGGIHCFSHNKELDYENTLNGFYNYAHSLDENIFQDNADLIIFGEWTGAKNKIVYDKETTGKWYIFDIYNKETEEWYLPATVAYFCKKYDLAMVNTLYDGEFISWEHCRSFMNKNTYGPIQEGIVVRDVVQMLDTESKVPFILKLVNKEFKESMIKQPKVVDPEKEAARKNAEEMLGQIVTRARVEKILIKLQQEENMLPRTIETKDMSLVAKCLPKAVHEDLVKEEPEVMEACGEYGGKICSGLTMRIAREIILGGEN